MNVFGSSALIAFLQGERGLRHSRAGAPRRWRVQHSELVRGCPEDPSARPRLASSARVAGELRPAARARHGRGCRTGRDHVDSGQRHVACGPIVSSARAPFRYHRLDSGQQLGNEPIDSADSLTTMPPLACGRVSSGIGSHREPRAPAAHLLLLIGWMERTTRSEPATVTLAK